jgi:hypothetical protein
MFAQITQSKSRNENNTYDIYNGNNINEIQNSSEMSYIDERIDAQYIVEINKRLGDMSYIRRCGYVNDIIGIYHDDGLNTWIQFEIMDEIKIFDKVRFIINCIHVVCFIIHVINFVHLIICIHITHFH